MSASCARSKLRIRDAQFSSKAYGTREYKEISIDGRIQFDLLVRAPLSLSLMSSLQPMSAPLHAHKASDVPSCTSGAVLRSQRPVHGRYPGCWRGPTEEPPRIV